MTSRARILAALAHQPVDRVPMDLGGTRQSGISAFAYARLRQALGLPERAFKVFDVFQMLAEIEPEVVERFGADCVAVQRPAVAFGIANLNYKPWTMPGGVGVQVPGGFAPEREDSGDLVLRKQGAIIARMARGSYYFDRLEKYPGALHPDLDTFTAPRLASAELDHYGREAERLFTQTDKAVVIALGPPYELFNGIGQGGFEEWMMTFAGEPDYVEGLYTKLVDAWLENLHALYGAVGDRVQVLQIADDFGMQTAPFMSVEMFRARLLPHYKRGLDWVHAHTPWKVMLHSDGALYPLLDALVEMGVDILNPVQTTATGMEAARLKRDFGPRLVFWGGACDSQHTLVRGTPEDVGDEVRRNLETFMPGSGYVCASVHNIQADVPAANIIAQFEAARAFGVAASAAAH